VGGWAYAYPGDLFQAPTDLWQILAIGVRLAQQDPKNAQWQTDAVVSGWKLAHRHGDIAEHQIDRRALLERGLAILPRLHGRSPLTRTQEAWIIQFERVLQLLPPPNHTA
jgi:hypothetical protein